MLRGLYPLSVKGRFQRLHRWTGLALQAFLFITPWITVAGHPAVQFDIGARRAFILGEVFTPRDTIFLVILGLFSAFSLFFFTALYGRLWCGYACPQTVFLEEWVRPIEQLLEGDRGVRMARDRKPMHFDRAWRKVGKLIAFAALAAVVGMTFVSWFTGARPLWTGGSSTTAYGVVAALSGVMFLDFAWFREQFCNYLCPYARFQGALADDGSLVVAYQVELGEPRKGTGACISCEKCVAVCPQGIDIREGFQLECITCARCVDACQGVMEKQGHPESLIVYKPLVKRPALRPRTFAYGSLLTALAVALVVLVVKREPLDATVARAPGSLYTIDADGWVRNTFFLRLSNNSLDPIDVSIASNMSGAEVLVPPVHLEPTESGMAPVVVRLPPAAVRERTLPLEFVVSTGETRLEIETTFKTGG